MGKKREENNDTVDEESTSLVHDERSAIAQEIQDLRETVSRLTHERERLPQPLFWSLFHNRLNKIRKTKELTRTLSQLLDGVEENE